MSATKLRVLLEAAGKGPWQLVDCGNESYGVADADGYEVSWHEMYKPNAQLCVAAPALARLVLNLTEVAADAYHFLPEHPHAADHACADVCFARDRAQGALAAVEGLEL